MKVTVLLCDAAQAVGGKLYILGGGWSIVAGPSPMSLAIKIEVPWDQANTRHTWNMVLTDDDGKPVSVELPQGTGVVQLGGEFEVGRPPGLLAGTPIDLPLALNIGPLPLEPGRRYTWRLSIDGEEDENWPVSFSTRPAGQAAAP